MIASAAFATLSVVVPTRACATEIGEVTVADSDIEALHRAAIVALKADDNTIPIFLTLKTWAQMPTYDRAWHYDEYGGKALKELYDFNPLAQRARFADEPLRLIPSDEAAYGSAVDMACREIT